MEAIHVEQAVFGSSDRGRMKGYQLVAKSCGIDRTLAQELCRWAPTQFPNNDPDDWTVNYFPVLEDSVVVSRTVLGGPEYSRRGAFQVVTLILLLSNEQFELYDCNPIAVARTALMTGELRLPMDVSGDEIPPATLPSQPIASPPCAIEDDALETDEDANGSPIDETLRTILDEVIGLLEEDQRVAVIGLADPIEMVERVVLRRPFNVRREFSFTTGLLPAVRRPFHLHFLHEIDVAKRRNLDSQKIVRVHAD